MSKRHRVLLLTFVKKMDVSYQYRRLPEVNAIKYIKISELFKSKIMIILDHKYISLYFFMAETATTNPVFMCRIILPEYRLFIFLDFSKLCLKFIEKRKYSPAEGQK